MKSYEKTHSRKYNLCSRCGGLGHFAFEHATGTMEPFGKDRVVVDFNQMNNYPENLDVCELYDNTMSALRGYKTIPEVPPVKLEPNLDLIETTGERRKLIHEIRSFGYGEWCMSSCSKCGWFVYRGITLQRRIQFWFHRCIKDSKILPPDKNGSF